MSYLSLQRKLENHEIMALCVLVVGFVVAFTLMFVHPTGALFVFALSLIFLLGAVIIGQFIVKAERAVARESLAHEACPKCGAHIEAKDGQPESRHCPDCGADFLTSGVEQL